MTEPKRYEVEITRPALRDLREIATYRAEKRGQDQGIALTEEVLHRITTLEQFPMRGAEPKEVREFNREGFRQVLLGRLRIVYAIVENRVAILLIADGRRDMQRLLRERLLARPPSD